MWPGSVQPRTNVVDEGDVVALVKGLRPRFDPSVESFAVDSGSHAHDAVRYLTTPEAGRAVANGCSGD